MPTTIKLKNSVTTTNAPSSLAQGEVAINITDKKVWVGNAATTPIQLLGDGGSASFTSIAFGAGTVSNPSITFTGDTNTGIYSPAADTIAFTEGGVESMRIDSSGNVGIGTSSPTRLLSVNGAIGALTLRLEGSVNPYVSLNDGTNTSYLQVASSALNINVGGANPITFTTNSSERMRITSTGNVGIGTNNPSALLHVSNASAKIRIGVDGSSQYTDIFRDNSTGYTVYNAAQAATFRGHIWQLGGSEAMRIDSSGNVGIGTSSPAARLDARGAIYAGDGTNTLQIGAGWGSTATQCYVATGGASTQMIFGLSGVERMRIDSSGNVGIGTSSPATKAEIYGTAAASNLALRITNTATDGYSTLQLGDANAGIYRNGSTQVNYAGASSLNLITVGAHNIGFSTQNTLRVIITSAGNVGIGNGNPSYQLSMSKAASNYIEIANTAASITSYYGTSDNGAWVGTSSSHPTIFYTAGSERMRITSGGELLVGTTDTNPNSGNGVKISAGTGARTSVVGSADTNANFAMTVYSTSPAAYRFQVGYGGTIYATSTSITAISDATLKTNVKDLETGLKEIMALQPRRFDWINGDATNVAGFIAQEVQQVLPDLVEDYQYSDNETKLGLKMGDILPTLVKAIQEQQAMIEELTNRIKKLEGVK